MSRRTTLSLLSVLAIAGIFLTACAVDPEKSPAYLKLSNKLKALEDGQQSAKRSIEKLYIDVDLLNDDVKNLKGALQTASASPEAKKELAAALQRVGQMEQQLKSIGDALAAQKKETEAAAAALKAAAARTASSPSASSTVAAARPAATEAKSAAARAPKEGPKSKGFYYQVRKGDTLEAIARQHKTSSAALCRANNLPLDAPLYPGQSLYVPQS